MVGSRPQSLGDTISMENSLELSTTTLVHFYQQQQQQGQLLQQQQQQINQQSQQFYINENQNSDNEDFDETNSEPHLSFPFVASYASSGDKSMQVKVINFSK